MFGISECALARVFRAQALLVPSCFSVQPPLAFCRHWLSGSVAQWLSGSGIRRSLAIRSSGAQPTAIGDLRRSAARGLSGGRFYFRLVAALGYSGARSPSALCCSALSIALALRHSALAFSASPCSMARSLRRQASTAFGHCAALSTALVLDHSRFLICLALALPRPLQSSPTAAVDPTDSAAQSRRHSGFVGDDKHRASGERRTSM